MLIKTLSYCCKLETNRKQYLLTNITLWHGNNDLWHPELGPITEAIWKTEVESQHWVDLAHTLQEHKFPWAKIAILETDIIQCQDAEIEGSIFGIKHHAHFD